MNKKITSRTTSLARKTARVRYSTTLLQKAGLVLFGIFLTLILLEAGLRLGGAAFLFFQESRNLRSLRAQGYRILCLGESTTANQYPPFLERALNRHGQGIKFSVIDKGLPSVDTDVILAQLEANLDKYKPDLVVTMMGINDQGEFMPPESKSSSGFVRWLFSWRVVKLARLLRLHLMAKMGESKEEVKTAAPQVAQPPKATMEGLKENVRNFGIVTGQEFLDPSGGPYSSEELKALFDGWKALSEGDHELAGRRFKEALAKNAKNAQAYYGLSWVCRNAHCPHDRVEDLLLKIIELHSANESVFSALGDYYLFEGKYEQAEAAYKKADLFDHKGTRGALPLAHIHMIQGEYAKAEAVLKRCVAKSQNELCCHGLASLYVATGREKEVVPCEQKAPSLAGDWLRVSTVENYRKLKKILDRRKIKLVCAQYPLRNVFLLKKIFPPQEEVYFVDNEETFKAAVAGGRLHEYFSDMFAGDFGHCTNLGNELLAGNIAKVILRDTLRIPVSEEAFNH